jgi:hypothetical protein
MQNSENPRLLNDSGTEKAFSELLQYSVEAPSAHDNTRCVICKGSRRLCGKDSCPVLMKYFSYARTKPLIDSTDIECASPPSVFIGRIGYPHVYIGPLIPPVQGDTSMYDMPEQWIGKNIAEIMDFRSQLVRGKYRVEIQDVEKNDKIVELTREMALAKESTPTEAQFTKRPAGRIVLDDEVQPFGPSAQIRDLNLSNTHWDHHMENAYSDTDLRAVEAVRELYSKGVMVTKIQRAFSVGAFGIEKNRRMVPTRWSITAVDDILSKNLVRKVKQYPEISEYRIYESRYLDNVFEVLMLPLPWSYEAIEAWYPGTTWNPNGKQAVMFGDWEGIDGRTTYAEIGGCYYAARLAVCERLVKEQRQAAVAVLREARPGYIMPVGVWQVRENVRNAMRQPPYRFNTLELALKWIAARFQIPLQQWISKSALIKNALFQKRITDYFSRRAA